MRNSFLLKAGLLLVCGLLVFAEVGAQKRYSVALSAGYTSVKSNNNVPLFADTDEGWTLGLSGTVNLGVNWGGRLILEQATLSLKTDKIVDSYLVNDPQASSMQISSGNFSQAVAGAGIFYDLRLTKKFIVKISPFIGVSYLKTPELYVAVVTAPHTQYHYDSGNAMGLLYGIDISPGIQLNGKISVHVNIGFDYAAHRLNTVFNGSNTSYDINYKRLKSGLGIGYRF